MNRSADRAFGALLRSKRVAAELSQTGLSQRLRWPQAKLSRVEQGKRSVTLPELLAVAEAFQCAVNDLLGALESPAKAGAFDDGAENAKLSPAFAAAWSSEEALMSHLARHGVRFLGESPRPVLASLPLDETVLAALRHMGDPRVFEALPALLVMNAGKVDWSKLTSAAYSLGLQNRLGAVLATALRLKDSEPRVEPRVWAKLQGALEALAERKLAREEVVGTRPKTEAALELLRRRTPEWLRSWHVLGSGDLDSARRYLRP
jgi:transcriptional regulator with XRE-family HTH domain